MLNEVDSENDATLEMHHVRNDKEFSSLQSYNVNEVNNCWKNSVKHQEIRKASRMT
jgi:hypothetical protein